MEENAQKSKYIKIKYQIKHIFQKKSFEIAIWMYIKIQHLK